VSLLRRADRALFSSAAVIALACAAPAAAQDAVEVADARTDEQIATSTAGDGGTPSDVTITETGSIDITDPALTPVLTLDSDNVLTNAGVITVVDGADQVGVLLRSGGSRSFANTGFITLSAPDDPDADDDVTPPLSTNRVGVLLEAGGTFAGEIGLGSISVTGDQSFAARIAGDLDGSATQEAGESISVAGENSVALAVEGGVSQDVDLSGSVFATGIGSNAIVLDGDVGGVFRLGGRVSANGYEETFLRDTDEDGELDTLEDRLPEQTGAAVLIRSSVAGGFLLDGPAATDSLDDDDDDGDLFDPGEQISQATIDLFGSAPALYVTPDGGGPIVIGRYIEPEDEGPGSGPGPDGVTGTADDDTPEGEDEQESGGSYGMVLRGSISSGGVFSTVSSTAIAIGDGDVTVEGGVNVEATVSANAFNADATAVDLRAGAQTPLLRLEDLSASIRASVTGEETTVGQAVGVDVAAGAVLSSLENNGLIDAFAVGSAVDAIAVRDASGTLDTVLNTGVVRIRTASSLDEDGEIIDRTGANIAFDLSANTTGVFIENRFAAGVGLARDGSSNTARITGDILLGSGDDQILTSAGAIVGDIDFGGGFDTLTIDPPERDRAETEDQLAFVGGAIDFGAGGGVFTINRGAFTGAIVSDDPIDIVLNGGETRLVNFTQFPDSPDETTLGVVNVGDLTIGPDADYFFQVDGSRAGDDQAVRFIASGSATIADGASITPVFNGDFPGEAGGGEVTLTLIDAAGGIDIGAADLQSVLGDVPFLFDVVLDLEAGGGTGGGDLLAGRFSLRSAERAGVETGQFTAYDVLIESIQEDDALRDEIGAVTTEAAFLEVFNELLPDYSDAAIAFQTAIAEGARRAVAGRASAAERDTPGAWSIWGDEFTYVLVTEQNGNQQGFSGGGFGFAFGADKPVGPIDAVGVMAAFSGPTFDVKSASATRTAAVSYEIGPYVAMQTGGFAFDLSASYGLVDYDSDRTVSVGDVRREAVASWSGNYLTAGARASWEKALGRRYYVRPEASFSYVSLDQDAFQEGGLEDPEGVALGVAARDDASARAIFDASFGYRRGSRFGSTTYEARLGVRQEFVTDAPETTVTPLGSTESFTLVGEVRSSTAVRGGAGISFFSGQFSQVDLTYDAELADAEMRHEFRIVGRLRF